MIDINNYFNNDDDYYANQQLISCKDLFRGVIVKCWAIDTYNIVNFYPYNKGLIENFIKNYHDYCKRRCIVLHSTDGQRKVLKEDALTKIEEASMYEVVGLKIHVEFHKMNVSNATIEDMLSRVRSTRVYKRIVIKRVNQCIRNMMNARVN